MNQQIPGFSANYAAQGPCVSCQQGNMLNSAGSANNAMTIQMPGSKKTDVSQSGGFMPESSMPAGNMAGSMQTNVLPSAIQQPGIQSMVMGTDAMAQMTAQSAPSTPATTQLMPITDTTRPAPMTMDSVEFLNGFLRTQIGRRVRVEFLIGTNTFTDKSGLLIGVGANYILLREATSDDILTCDFFNIKFVTIFY